MDSTMLPLDSSCQAEYEDGFVLDETHQDDVSLFADGKNIFHDILNCLPEVEHGRMVRFSVFWKDARYDIDWRNLPDSARPIRFRHGYATRSISGDLIESGWSGVDFGYQANNPDGSNYQEIVELR